MLLVPPKSDLGISGENFPYLEDSLFLLKFTPVLLGLLPCVIDFVLDEFKSLNPGPKLSRFIRVFISSFAVLANS